VELSLLQFSAAGKRTLAPDMLRLIVHHTHPPLSAHRLIIGPTEELLCSPLGIQNGVSGFVFEATYSSVVGLETL
jgi:hypothetical protein